MVPLNLACLHCLQHSFFEHDFCLFLDGNKAYPCILSYKNAFKEAFIPNVIALEYDFR